MLRDTLACLSLFVSSLAWSAPKAELWERWTLHDESSARVINHSIWEKFLSTYLVEGSDGINRVRYGAVSPSDRGYLRIYLDDLKRIPVSTLRRAEQRAYWINLYNAQTVKLVMEWFPVSSIQSIDITPGWFSKGPWGAKLIRVEDQTLSLDDVEHRILRPIWKDPRIHYALNCAALGCPNLSADIYTAGNMEAQLENAAHHFINHPRGVKIMEDGTLRVSSIYQWYADDFGGTDAAVIQHLMQYAKPALKKQLESLEKISDYEYDWLLNGQ